jgi:hypothetical protein
MIAPTKAITIEQFESASPPFIKVFNKLSINFTYFLLISMQA